jgi:phage tail sheath protein FI
MSESAGSNVFSSAGMTGDKAHPIIRVVLMAASGVVPMLSSSLVNSAAPASTTPATAAGPRGALTGTVLLLNGHKSTDRYPSAVTASFDVTAPNYVLNVFNTDPTLLEDAGHYLYANYDIHTSLAVITGTNIFTATASFGAGASRENLVFITTGSLARNSGSTVVPNFESFENRFTTARTPYVISQRFGGSPRNLFRFHALDDGAYPNDKYKFSIRNITKSTSQRDQYGSFDVVIRDMNDTDENPVVVEQFLSVNLNPSSDRYIKKVIGDRHVYFDFDKNADGQKLVVDGDFPNASKIVRVEVDPSVNSADVPATALPAGFRGHRHLVTSGSSILSCLDPHGQTYMPGQGTAVKRAVEPPVPFRSTLTYGVEPKQKLGKNLYWGVQFELADSVTEPNRSSTPNETVKSFTKYFPDFHTTWQNPWVGDNEGTADSGGTVFDADRFNNNIFSLENVSVRTGSNGLADPKEWLSASYTRVGSVATNDTLKTRAFSLETDLDDATARALAKFTFYMQGGFDGVRLFDEPSVKMNNAAVVQEMGDTARGQSDGPTVSAYRKALEIMGEKSDVDIKILAMPGIRHNYLTDLAVSTVEDRFDALFLMDVEERDTYNSVVTSSDQQISVTNTVSVFADRAMDTSFAAAYFPDQIVVDPTTNTNVQVPPSVVVLGAMSLNDLVAHPWFAPAGFTRGALQSSVGTTVQLSRANLDALYGAGINPLTSFPNSGPVVWGQKTLQAMQSSLDRVNVRRLLIEIRREVRQVANTFIFEQNRDDTLSSFERAVRPRLQRIQDLQGVDKFKVKIDTTTTTQADVDNLTIKGKIYVQPTKTAEFVSIDFAVSNAGASI